MHLHHKTCTFHTRFELIQYQGLEPYTPRLSKCYGMRNSFATYTQRHHCNNLIQEFEAEAEAKMEQEAPPKPDDAGKPPPQQSQGGQGQEGEGEEGEPQPGSAQASHASSSTLPHASKAQSNC